MKGTRISRFFFPFCFVILLTLTSQCVVLLILNSFYDDAANNLQSLYVRPVDGRPMFRGRPVRPIDSSRISFRREELRKRAAGLSLQFQRTKCTSERSNARSIIRFLIVSRAHHMFLRDTKNVNPSTDSFVHPQLNGMTSQTRHTVRFDF